MENKNKIDSDRKYYLFAIKIIGDFGGAIAIPVIAFVLVGDYLENRYNFAPWGIIGGFALAALVSAKIIYRKAKEYGSEYEKLNSE